MSAEDWWKIALRLKLRQSSGDHFQDFFSIVMEKIHGSDFVRVRPFGAKGDKGCDGYLKSTGQVFQCYGAINGDKSKVGYLIEKMGTDFSKAKVSLSGIMKEWYMVHNLVDGLPIDAVQELNAIEAANPNLTFGFIGLEGLESRIYALTYDQKSELLGPAATNQDSQNLQVEELKSLIDGVMQIAEKEGTILEDIEPVPVDKLQANKLPYYCKALISSGWQNAHIVTSYLNSHHDPLRGEKIAKLFRDRYQYLKAQKLNPDSIMVGLYEYVTGIGSVHPERQVAAQALLAHLFESCDIFENVTADEAS